MTVKQGHNHNRPGRSPSGLDCLLVAHLNADDIRLNITIQANDPGAFVASERLIELAVALAVRRGLRS